MTQHTDPSAVHRIVTGFPLWRHPSFVCAALVWLLWWIFCPSDGLSALFAENWPIALNMVFGSFIAGATSEGGGAVAFPVLTLVFGTAPAAARDFSLMIQSVGMTAATLTILMLRIPIATGPIVFVSAGGATGMIVGLEVIAPIVPPAMAKIFFTSCWLSFGIALVLINLERARGSQRTSKVTLRGNVERIGLVGVGFLGGVISSLTGSGLDLLTFSVLVLMFRVCESVATPTSVILMAVNAMVGFAWKASFASDSIQPIAWDFWIVCIPIVVLGAPFGAIFISYCSRRVIVGILLTSIVVQYIAALILPSSSAKRISN